MNYRFLLITAFNIYTGSVTAQMQFHTPSEILELIANSKVHYKIWPYQPMDKSVPHRKVFHEVLAKSPHNSNTPLVLQEIQTEALKKEIAKALKYANNAKSDYEKALKILSSLAVQYSGHSEIYDLCATLSLEVKKPESAVLYYKKALEMNPEDYLANWKLGAILADSGKTDLAFGYLFKAHLLNRNQSEIFSRLIHLKKQPANKEVWAFEPEYNLKTNAQQEPEIYAEGIWLTYALYKAVWEYESGYKENMVKVNQADRLILEGLESLLGLSAAYAALATEKNKRIEALEALNRAIENDMVQEFLFYEVILPEYPEMGVNLQPEFIKRLEIYYKAFH
jgi:tetratricopeptide (TPR) repeat protein